MPPFLTEVADHTIMLFYQTIPPAVLIWRYRLYAVEKHGRHSVVQNVVLGLGVRRLEYLPDREGRVRHAEGRSVGQDVEIHRAQAGVRSRRTGRPCPRPRPRRWSRRRRSGRWRGPGRRWSGPGCCTVAGRRPRPGRWSCPPCCSGRPNRRCWGSSAPPMPRFVGVALASVTSKLRISVWPRLAQKKGGRGHIVDVRVGAGIVGADRRFCAE